MSHNGNVSSLKLDIKIFAAYIDIENMTSYTHVAMYKGNKIIDILAVQLAIVIE